MTVYRARRPWWRSQTAGLVVAVCGYLMIIIGLSALAGLLLP